MASRSRTQIFMRYRDTLRTHKRGTVKINQEMREFKPHKNLLAAQSDDEGSTVDARVYSVPPVWVTMVDDMNRDISQIKIKSAPPPLCSCFLSSDAQSRTLPDASARLFLSLPEQSPS